MSPEYALAENRTGRIRLAFGPPPTHPRISKAVEKNDALPAVDAWCGEAIAMAGYVASATTAGTHDGTLNIEGKGGVVPVTNVF